MQWNIHLFCDGIIVIFPGKVSTAGVLIASMNKSLCCLFVPCVTSTNQTSGCIVTRRIISSLAIDIWVTPGQQMMVKCSDWGCRPNQD